MLYLAMTGAEIAENSPLAGPIAYMACHFAPYGAGLSNMPASLPPGSMLILNDRMPIMGHDTALAARQLADTAQKLQCSRILLDLQRQGEYGGLIAALLEEAPCPVGVSAPYAANFSCPVFLPPIPFTATVEEHFAPWISREIWLELAADTEQICITASGSRHFPASTPENPLLHFDRELLCHYRLTLSEAEACFTLTRSWNDLQELMNKAGCSCFVGLYQQLEKFVRPSCNLQNP